MGVTQEKPLEQLCGTVEQVVFYSAESGFGVIDLDADGELISVVGVMGEVGEGEQLSLMGYYTTHPTHGYQFKAQTCEHQIPQTAAAIEKYLASGVIKGIGAALAKRIVKQFGDDTLQVIEHHPDRLAEVKGITVKRAETLSATFRQLFGVRRLMLYLAQYGISAARAVEIYRRWGPSSQQLLEQNPYLLCMRPLALPFSIADRMAQDLAGETHRTERVLAGLSHTLCHNLLNGHTCLPADKLCATAKQLLQISDQAFDQALAEILQAGDLCLVQKNKDFLALPDLYDAERYIAMRIRVMASTKSQLPLSCKDEQALEQQISQIEARDQITYDPLQRTAMKEALKRQAFILTGGPGTGKTTTLNGLITLLSQNGLDLVLAAPTGRAAKRLSEVTGRDAKTIHRLLEVQFEEDAIGFAKNQDNPLDADVVIIDEMSMVDTLLFEALLSALKPSSKLILVGDYDQLPSVGAGNVLKDLLQSERVTTVRLTHIFRQAQQSLIVRNAHHIVLGEYPVLDQKDSDFFFLERPTADAAAATVLELMVDRLPKAYGYSPFEEIQVLSPGRKGEIGVLELNKKLQAKLNPKGKHTPAFTSPLYRFHEGDKVMQTKNNYDIEWEREHEREQGVFNGDIGTICMIDRGAQTVKVDFDGKIAYYNFEIASEQLELAYAITVHKSQGNEFPAVILPILGGYDRLYYRNLLYTAVTRAKQLLILVGRADRIRFMVDNHLKLDRFTLLTHLLTDGQEAPGRRLSDTISESVP